MNMPSMPKMNLIATAVAFSLLAACAAAPTKPDGADDLRSRLTQLQSNPDLASRAPLAIKEADLAVTAAEKPQSDKVLAAHLVFLADRKIDTAQAQAESRLAVDQRKTLEEEREAMRLQARTREADAANRRATVAEADASNQRREADAARDGALAASAEAERNAQELARQIAELEARETERGLVLTLGDVLFTSGTANLNEGVGAHLGKLAAFLTQYPERTVLIEGYTDSVGTEEYNQGLSERRAEAVKSYLVRQDILSSRLTASGKGESSPIGDNATATGRQQNRRVEVIIEKNLVSAR
jgi:outer membrane protein OmpA-like peptidoglycan-associated protein